MYYEIILKICHQTAVHHITIFHPENTVEEPNPNPPEKKKKGKKEKTATPEKPVKFR